MTTVRPGTPEDFGAIVKMARDFWAHTMYDDPFDEGSVEGMAKTCYDHGLLSVLEVDGVQEGFACGLKGGLLANNAVPCGTEVAWWVNPDFRSGSNGIRLLKHLESLAKAQNIKYWNMSCMYSSMPDHVTELYERLGYRKAEIAYTRVL